MWELRQRVLHGRSPVRRFSLLVTTALLTFFVAAFAFTPSAHADDATRSGDAIVYQDNTYEPVGNNLLPKDITAQAANAEGYRYLDTTDNKAYFLITSSTAAQATSAYYVVYDFTPPDNYSNSSPPVEVAITSDAPAADEEDAEDVSACDNSTLSGIGWIVCPTVNFIAKGMDKIYQIISEFLVVRTVTADTNSSLYQLWTVVRDIANICFVIAILVIVYSQLTSVGISNYGVKHMLPRLIIAAIMVNISYWICAVAVDISNILGYAIHALFMGIMNKFSVGGNYTGSIPTWEQVAAVALAGTGAVAGGLFILANTVTGSIFLLIPLLISAICAALIALIVLAVRQALITIFIILSPLAFVAYVLPNTEKYFDKWRQSFITLMVLFPVFSVIFSGAQLAGMAIVQSAGGNLFTIVLGLAVQVAPIVITPMLVKFSGTVVGRVANMLNNPNKGIVDRSRNWAKGAAAERKNKVVADQTMLARSRLRNNPFTAGSKAINNYRRRVDGRRKVYEGMADNAFAATRHGQQLEGMNRDVANDKQEIENRFADSQRGRQTEIRSRNLGVEKQEIENSLLRSTEGHALTRRQQLAEIDKTRVHNEFEASHAGHQVDTAKRTVEMEKKRIENTHQANWDNAVRTDPGLLELELSVKGSELKAGVAKAKLDKMHAEIAAQGHTSEHILNLRGVDMRTQAGMLNIAHDIKEDNFDTQVIASAKNMAERKIKEQFAENLSKSASGAANIRLDNIPVHLYAGGIMGQAGVNSVVARAKTDFSSVMVESIKNVKNTLNYEDSTNPDILFDKFIAPDASLEDKVAYAWTMTERGGPGNIALRKAIAHMDAHYAPDSDDMQGFKELLGSMSGAMKSGKDIEFWLTNTRDSSTGHLRDLRSLSNDSGTWNALQVEAFAGMNMISQLKALRTYAHSKPDLYNKLIADIKANPQSYAALKPTVKNAMEFAPDAPDPSDPTRLYWSLEALRDRAGNPTLDFDDPW